MTAPKHSYRVSLDIDIDAPDAEAAAIEFDRLTLTTRPKDLHVTARGGGTVFIRVERGDAKRIA
jgi:hypothetical protein